MDPVFSCRRPITLGLLTLALLAALLLGWGLFARIDGAVIVPGQIEVERNRQIIQHAEGGTLIDLRVREGEAVAQGAILLRLDDARLARQIASLSLRRNEALAQKARLEAERDGLLQPIFPKALTALRQSDPAIDALLSGQSRLFDARLASAQRQIQQLRLQITQIEQQNQALGAQLQTLADLAALSRAEAERQTGLVAKGLAPEQSLAPLRRDLLQIEASRTQYLADEAEAKERRAALELEIDRIDHQRRDEALAELRELDPLLAELTERLGDLTTQREALTIRAPISGRVFGLTLSAPPAVIRPAEPIFYLIPDQRDLVITALVPALSIDKIFEGQEVFLRLPGLEDSKAARLAARVSSLSADVFADQMRGPVYRAELRLAPGEVDRLASPRGLLPGMPVEAYLLTGRRSPLEALLSPFTRYFSRSLRAG